MAIKRTGKKDIVYCPVSDYSKQPRFTVNGLHVADTTAGTTGVMGTLWEVGGERKWEGRGRGMRREKAQRCGNQ